MDTRTVQTPKRRTASALRLLSAFGLGAALAIFAAGAPAPTPSQPGDGARAERPDRRAPAAGQIRGDNASEYSTLKADDLREHLEGLIVRLDEGEAPMQVARDLCFPFRRAAEDRGRRMRQGDPMRVADGVARPEGAPPSHDEPVTARQLTTIMNLLQAVDAERATKLAELREQNPDMHERFVRRLRTEFWGVIATAEDNPALFAHRVNELKARRAAALVAQRIARAELDGTKPEELESAYGTLREHLTIVHRESLATAENEWERLRQRLDERALKIEEYVENDVQVLIRVFKEKLSRPEHPRERDQDTRRQGFEGRRGGPPGAGGPPPDRRGRPG